MDTYSIENGQQEMTIDIKKYFYLFWQWVWLILLVAVIAAVTAFFISQQLTPVYRATTRVMVDVPAGSMSEAAALTMSERLSRTYAEMMTNRSLLQETIVTLGLPMTPTSLADMITVRSVPNTQLMEVQVESIDPQAAVVIANSLVSIFSAEIRELQTGRFDQSRANIEAQMLEVEQQIAETTAQLQGQTQGEARDRLETRLTQQQQVYATLIASYEQLRLSEAQSISTVVIYDPATVPDSPIRPRPLVNAALAGLTGLLLTAGGIFAVDALDDRLKSPDEISQQLDLPVLGVIDNHNPNNGGQLITAVKPRSPITEDYRTLRTNVNFASVDRQLRSILVVSAEPAEGKTTVASNLAVVFAQSGLETYLVDCDLRRPQLHTRFDLSNQVGLTSLFYQRANGDLDDYLQTPFKQLNVLTAGSLPPNPAELLGSQRMVQLLEKIKKESEILILDTPPVLAVTDAVVLSSFVDGILIVVQPGKTRLKATQTMLEELRRADARILGVAVKIVGKSRHARRYGYYARTKYDNYYHMGADDDAMMALTRTDG